MLAQFFVRLPCMVCVVPTHTGIRCGCGRHAACKKDAAQHGPCANLSGLWSLEFVMHFGSKELQGLLLEDF